MESVLNGVCATIQIMYNSVFALGVTELLVIPAFFIIAQNNINNFEKLKKLYLVTGVMLILFGTVFYSHTNDFEGYFTGFLNIFPTDFVIAFGITEMVFNTKNSDKKASRKKKVEIVTVFMLCILFLGKSNYMEMRGESKNENNIRLFELATNKSLQVVNAGNEVVHNRMKLPDEVISIVNAIRVDKENPVIVAPYDYGLYIRQYSPECKLVFGRYSTFWNAESRELYKRGDIEILDDILAYCEKYDIDAEYIVFPQSDDVIYNDTIVQTFKEYGWDCYMYDAGNFIFKLEN